jgi:oligopeptide transport system substrate-binding protein
MGLALSVLLGLGLALGLIWLLGYQPVARAQVIAPSVSEGLQPEMGDTFDAPASTAALPSEPHIRLEKNQDYYDAASVVITQATSPFIGQTEAWARYQTGELDTIAPPGSALETIKSTEPYSSRLQAYPRPIAYYYGFSHDVPPFDDPLVRAAFASAIDRPRLIEEVESLTGDEFPALTFAAPGLLGHVDGYSAGIGRPYSPTLANDLLASSGYTGTPTITLMFNTNSHHQAVAEAVQQMWDDTLGISVTLKAMDWGTYQDLIRNGSAAERPGVWRWGWLADYPDAHNFLSVFAGDTQNIARYDSSAYNALLDAAASESNSARRRELYAQAEATLVMTDTAIAPLYYYVNHRLTRPDLVRTYRPMGGQHLDEWDLSGDVRPLELAWGNPSSLDPALASNDYVEQLFLGLTDFDEEGNVTPELAASWDVSDDATVYTFTMRGDAVWTDGSPVTAQDVEYGVLRSLDPDTGSGAAYVLYVIENAQAYHLDGSVSDPDLVGVEALDDTHVRFTLKEPAAYFPAIASLPVARPQPQSAIETYGCGWTAPENIVTNGPYELVSWEGPPHLSINKSAAHRPLAGGDFTFEITYQNAGAGAAADVVITDSMDGFSYISDTSSFPHTGSGAWGDPLVWDLDSVPAHSCGSFEVRVQVTRPAGSEVWNRAQIATSDPDDQGESWEKMGEWRGNVEGPSMRVHYGEDRVSGVYPVGHTFWITVTDDVGGVKGTAMAETAVQGAGPDGAWQQGFLVEGDDWSVPGLDIQPTDQVQFRADDDYTNTVEVGTITGEADPSADTLSGTITAPWLPTKPFVLSGEAGTWGFTFKPFWFNLDSATGAGDYSVDFSPYDLLPGQDVSVFYTEPDGDRVGNTVRASGGMIYLPLVTKNQ